jgi:hypothetical protein
MMELEKEMAKVFEAGYTTADRQVMDEIISFLNREGPKSWQALTRKASYLVESYRLDKVLDIMVRSGQIRDSGGNKWVATS